MKSVPSFNMPSSVSGILVQISENLLAVHATGIAGHYLATSPKVPEFIIRRCRVLYCILFVSHANTDPVPTLDHKTFSIFCELIRIQYFIYSKHTEIICRVYCAKHAALHMGHNRSRLSCSSYIINGIDSVSN
jgi:hypothetical protein